MAAEKRVSLPLGFPACERDRDLLSCLVLGGGGGRCLTPRTWPRAEGKGDKLPLSSV